MQLCSYLCRAGIAIVSNLPDFTFVCKLVFRRNARRLPLERGADLEVRVERLARRMGVRKRFDVIEQPHRLFEAQAVGSSLLFGRARIAINSELFYALPKDQQEFVLAREIAHVKHNDRFMFHAFSVVVTVVAIVALSVLFPPSMCFSPIIVNAVQSTGFLAISGISMCIFSRLLERRADTTAFDACSSEGKRGAIQFLERVRKIQLNYRNDPACSLLTRLWRRFLITEAGNFRIDVFFHPSVGSRIEYLKARALSPPGEQYRFSNVFLAIPVKVRNTFSDRFFI